MKTKASQLSETRYQTIKIIILLLFVVVAALLFFVRGQYKPMSFLGGDEPHYIMMTDSLIKDGDFNLKDDYEQSRALAYYPVPGLFPHIAVIIDFQNSDKWYSMHTVGLPLLMALPYKLAGVVGVRLELLILQLAAVLVFFTLLEKYLRDRYRAIIGMTILFCCTFFWQSLGGVFPDLIFVSFVGAAILLFARKDILSNIAFVGLLCCGGLIHTKVLLVVGPVFIAHHLYLISSIGIMNWLKRYSTYCIATLLFAIAYSSYLFKSYGVYLPSQLYGSKGQLFAGNMLVNGVAVLLDRTKGLVAYFPVIIVAGPYLYLAARGAVNNSIVFIKQRHLPSSAYLPISLLVGLAVLLATQLGFDDWSGSFAPNGRYMLVFIFALIFIVAKYVNYRSILELSVVGLATVVSALATVVVAMKLDIYLDTGVESVITSKFMLFKVFPLYPLVIKTVTDTQLYRSIGIVMCIVVFNVVLYRLYTNKRIKRKFVLKNSSKR